MRWLNNIGCWTQHTEPLSESLMRCQATSIKDVQKVLQIRCVWMFFFSETGSTKSCRFSLHNIRGFSALCCLFCILSSQHWATEPRSCQLFSCALSDHYKLLRVRNWCPEKYPQFLAHHMSLWLPVTKNIPAPTEDTWRHLSNPTPHHAPFLPAPNLTWCSSLWMKLGYRKKL